MKEGDSFDLDKKKWFVVEIRPDDVVFRVDNNQLTVEPADVFFSVDQIPQGPPAEEVGTQKPESEVEADESLKSDVS